MSRKIKSWVVFETQHTIEEKQLSAIFPSFGKLKQELEALGCTVKVKVGAIRLTVTETKPDKKD